MAKFVMIVQSEPLDGQDDVYNTWYDGTHIPELLQIPGITGARRLEATPIVIGAPGAKFVTFYEIEADNPGAVMAEMGARSADARMSASVGVDQSKATIWVYADR